MGLDELLHPFDRLLSAVVTPAVVRAVDAGDSPQGLWSELVASGYLDLLVPESAGGAGVSLADTYPLLALLGRYVVPLPVGETMIARALLAEACLPAPGGPLLLLAPRQTDSGWWQAGVPMGSLARHALVDDGERLRLVELDSVSLESAGLHASQSANVRWNTIPTASAELARPASGLGAAAALLRAVSISGAAGRILDFSLDYARERVQFGKPIGRQQAIQQQLALLAEQVLMARFAASMGCRAGIDQGVLAIAVAKQVTSAAVPAIAAIAHAVHGALGITAEFDLQLYTRRLHEWRVANGSETYWARMVGEARLASDVATSTDFVRRRITVPVGSLPPGEMEVP